MPRDRIWPCCIPVTIIKGSMSDGSSLLSEVFFLILKAFILGFDGLLVEVSLLPKLPTIPLIYNAMSERPFFGCSADCWRGGNTRLCFFYSTMVVDFSGFLLTEILKADM